MSVAPSSAALSPTTTKQVKVTVQVSYMLRRHVAPGEVAAAITVSLSQLAVRLGLELPVDVFVQYAGGDRPVLIRVNGATLQYEPRLLGRCWNVIAPEDQRLLAVPSDEAAFGGYGPDWLAKLVAGTRDEVIAAWLVEVVTAAVQCNPSCLLAVNHVRRLLATFGRPESSERLWRACSVLLDVNGRLDEVGAFEHQPKGSAIEDRVEYMLAELAGTAIRIHVSPTDLQALAPGKTDGIYPGDDSESGVSPITEMCEVWLFGSLGLPLPESYWQGDLEESGTCAVQVNALVGPRLRLPIDAPLFVRKSDAHRVGGKQTAALAHPVTCAPIVGVTGVTAESLEKSSIPHRDRATLIAELIYSELLRNAHRLVNVAWVMSQLELGSVDPALTSWALKRRSAFGITRVIRALVQEGISVRDIRTILWSLIDFSTVRTSPVEYEVVGHGIAWPASPPPAAVAWPLHLQHARQALSRQISSWMTSDPPRRVVLIADELERMAAQRLVHKLDTSPGGLHPDAAEQLRERLWEARKLGAVDFVLTSAAARLPIRQAIAGEFPHLHVIAREELKPEVRTTTVATVGVATAPSKNHAAAAGPANGLERDQAEPEM